MSAPDLVERTRMALAEVGYDPARVYISGWGTVRISSEVSKFDRWRAVSIARGYVDDQICLACRERAPFSGPEVKAAALRCRSDRPLVRDCGLTPSSPGTQSVGVGRTG